MKYKRIFLGILKVFLCILLFFSIMGNIYSYKSLSSLKALESKRYMNAYCDFTNEISYYIEGIDTYLQGNYSSSKSEPGIVVASEEIKLYAEQLSFYYFENNDKFKQGAEELAKLTHQIEFLTQDILFYKGIEDTETAKETILRVKNNLQILEKELAPLVAEIKDSYYTLDTKELIKSQENLFPTLQKVVELNAEELNKSKGCQKPCCNLGFLLKIAAWLFYNHIYLLNNYSLTQLFNCATTSFNLSVRLANS